MSNQGPEGARLAIKATLDTYLAAALSALNAEYNDGLTLLPPDKIYEYEQGSIPKMPFVQIFSTGGPLQIDGGGPVGAGWNQMGHDVVIQWFVTSDSVRHLQKVTDRYTLAIQRVLQEHKELDGSLDGGVGISLAKYQIGAMAKNTQVGLYMQTGAWQATVETVEFLR